jgi:hypothetical protein
MVIKIKEEVHEHLQMNSGCCACFFEGPAIMSSARSVTGARFVRDNGVREEFNLST